MIIRVRTVERRCSQYIDLRWGQSFSAVILLNYWIIEILNYCKFKLSSASRLWTYHLNEGAYGARAASLNYWTIELLNYCKLNLSSASMWSYHRNEGAFGARAASSNYWTIELLKYWIIVSSSFPRPVDYGPIILMKVHMGLVQHLWIIELFNYWIIELLNYFEYTRYPWYIDEWLICWIILWVQRIPLKHPRIIEFLNYWIIRLLRELGLPVKLLTNYWIIELLICCEHTEFPQSIYELLY